MAAMIMVSSAGYGVMFTVLDDIRDQFGVSESHLGLIVAIGFFASFLAQVLLAPLAVAMLVYLGRMVTPAPVRAGSHA